MSHVIREPVQGFRPGPTQTWLCICINRRLLKLQPGNFRFMKQRNCTFYVAKTKALISCAVTVQLICIFVFTFAKSRFSHDAAHLHTGEDNDDVEIKQTYISQYENMQISSILQPYPSENLNEAAEKKGMYP